METRARRASKVKVEQNVRIVLGADGSMGHREVIAKIERCL